MCLSLSRLCACMCVCVYVVFSTTNLSFDSRSRVRYISFPTCSIPFVLSLEVRADCKSSHFSPLFDSSISPLCPRRGLNPPHRVKSISMTTFTQQEIEFLQKHGNEVGTAIRPCQLIKLEIKPEVSLPTAFLSD